MRALATFCYRRRRIVLAAWLLALIAVTFVSRAAGSAYSDSFTLPNTESTRATWWFPKSLDRALPRLAVEPPDLLDESEGDELGLAVVGADR